MEALQRLGADDLKAVLHRYRDALRAHQESINRLNVYPVPDGDTGTNMALTVESVVTELVGCEGMAEVCRAVSHGSLMGARGNSGVILSQILRGVAKGFEAAPDGAGPKDVGEALAAAAAAAYQAVLRPVEGTILTVARAAGEAALVSAGRGSGLVELLDDAREAAADALAATPDQLPALRLAGVVDAGGAGYLLLLDAFLAVADARSMPEPDRAAVPARVGAAYGGADQGRNGGPGPGPDGEPPGAGVGDLRYEVMYFLEAPDETVPAFRDAWAGIGDSIVVVGGDNLWNCHIHTDDIGAAIEAALDVGRPRQIRVTDLAEQVDEERWVREAVPDGIPGGPVGQAVATAVVAVGSGAGLGRLFRSVGVQAVVAGGQSMNPSTAQILEAVEACPAPAVIILPNNKNIVAVAEQVAGLATKDVRVVRSRTLTEGLAAAFQYDPEGSADANQRAMERAIDGVVTGELTVAVRDAETAAGPVREGEYLGLSREGIVAVAPTLAEAGVALLARLVDGEHEIVTILEGDGATAATTRRLTEWLAEGRPDALVEVHHGGQPLYPYLFSIE